MRETPLITFTKADDAGHGQRDPGELDFIIHCDSLTAWLATGEIGIGEDVPSRCRQLAARLREMATHLEQGTGPVAVTLEDARKRYAERVRETMRSLARQR